MWCDYPSWVRKVAKREETALLTVMGLLEQSCPDSTFSSGLVRGSDLQKRESNDGFQGGTTWAQVKMFYANSMKPLSVLFVGESTCLILKRFLDSKEGSYHYCLIRMMGRRLRSSTQDSRCVQRPVLLSPESLQWLLSMEKRLGGKLLVAEVMRTKKPVE